MSEKVVIITGATSGIGLACAKYFAEQGFKTVMSGRNETKLNEIANNLNHNGLTIYPIVADISKIKECENLINKTIERFGRIDILINNAGISMRAMFKDLELDVIEKVIDTNFWGTVYCTKFALPWLLKSQGSVVGISSITGYYGLPGRTGYAASKFAMNGFLETLRMEHLNNGLHVMVVAPGFTNTDIRKKALTKNGKPQGKTPRKEANMMSAETVARHIFSGIKKRKRTIILTKIGKIGILLYKFFPAFMDKLVVKFMSKEPDFPK